MLDDEVGTSLVVDSTSETRFKLFGDAEVVENRQIACVQFDDILLFGGYECYIVPYLLEDILVVDIDTVVSGVEDIAKQGHGTAGLFVDQLWDFLGLLGLGNGVFPTLDESLHLLVELCHALAFG